MNCYWCNDKLVPSGDIDIDESMPTYPDFSVMTNLSCPKCDAHVEVYLSLSKFFDINKAKLLKNEGE